MIFKSGFLWNHSGSLRYLMSVYHIIIIEDKNIYWKINVTWEKAPTFLDNHKEKKTLSFS